MICSEQNTAGWQKGYFLKGWAEWFYSWRLWKCFPSSHLELHIYIYIIPMQLKLMYAIPALARIHHKIRAPWKWVIARPHSCWYCLPPATHCSSVFQQLAGRADKKTEWLPPCSSNVIYPLLGHQVHPTATVFLGNRCRNNKLCSEKVPFQPTRSSPDSTFSLEKKDADVKYVFALRQQNNGS